MTDPSSTLRSAREATIDALTQRFAADELSMPELERRLERARTATTREQLRALLADLAAPAAPPPAPVPKGGKSLAEPADATRVARPRPREAEELQPGSHLAIAVMGGTRRAGRWRPPGRMLAIAIMGGVELDFRDAVLAPGVTEIDVFTFWGGIEITVPPGVHVDAHGLALMAGFDQVAESESDPPPDAPTIRINGVAIMAGVEIHVRRPGEPKDVASREGGKKQLPEGS
jgi:Domain of unknown function (DUF1707)